MVYGPWVDLLQPTLHYQNKGGQPYDSLTTMRSATTKCRVFTILLQNLTQTWAFSPKIALGGSLSQQQGKTCTRRENRETQGQICGQGVLSSGGN